MRNLKRVLSLTLASVMLLGMMVVGASAAGYSDVDYENDNVEAIEVLQAVGVMTGYAEDGDFHPSDEVTRGQMARIMAALMDLDYEYYTGANPFNDMVGHWAEGYVAACYANGIVAGRTATTYDPEATVTTVEAAAMLMRALGYFQYASDYANGFELATLSQAGRIDLFTGVDTKTNEPMTRNDVAQLVLNTLKSGMVEPDDNTTSITTTVGGATTTVESGRVNYVYVTSREAYATAIRSDVASYASATATTNLTAPIVDLGEKLYQGELTLDEGNRDALGRPASHWEYKAKEIGTYADDPDYAFTSKVTSKKLYDTVGSTAANNYDWVISVNGVPEVQEDDGLTLLVDNRANDNACFMNKVNGATETGNGVVTEVFVDGTPTYNSTTGALVSQGTVVVAIYKLYAAEVLKVTSDGTITLSDLGSGFARASDEYATTAFDEDDIVVYTYSEEEGEIQSVALAQRIEGEITRVRTDTTGGEDMGTDGDQFVVDGETYSYNYTVPSQDRLQTENVNNGMVGYLDEFGYCIWIDESAISYEYAYVLSAGSNANQYGDIKGTTVYANLVLTDGTLVSVETDWTGTAASLQGQIVSYSVDRSGVYTLNSVYDQSTRGASIQTVGASLKLQNDVAGFTTDGSARYAANSRTLFIIADSDASSYKNYNFAVYEGIANVPDVDGVAGTKVAVATAQGSNVAKVVYIEDASISGAEVYFVRADSNAKLVKDSEIGNYHVINAIVDGEAVTLNVKEGTSADEILVTDIDAANKWLAVNTGRTQWIIPLKYINTNSDGLVTSVRAYDSYVWSTGSGVISGTATDRTTNGNIILGNIAPPTKVSQFTTSSNAVVVQYNNRNETNTFEAIRASSIKLDSNDGYIAVLDKDVITGICIYYQVGGENEAWDDGNPPPPPPPGDWEPASIEGASVSIVDNGDDTFTITVTAINGNNFVEVKTANGVVNMPETDADLGTNTYTYTDTFTSDDVVEITGMELSYGGVYQLMSPNGWVRWRVGYDSDGDEVRTPVAYNPTVATYSLARSVTGGTVVPGSVTFNFDEIEAGELYSIVYEGQVIRFVVREIELDGETTTALVFVDAGTTNARTGVYNDITVDDKTATSENADGEITGVKAQLGQPATKGVKLPTEIEIDDAVIAYVTWTCVRNGADVTDELLGADGYYYARYAPSATCVYTSHITGYSKAENTTAAFDEYITIEVDEGEYVSIPTSALDDGIEIEVGEDGEVVIKDAETGEDVEYTPVDEEPEWTEPEEPDEEEPGEEEEYTVTVNSGTGFTATGAGNYAEGESVTITITVLDGYRLKSVTANGTEVETELKIGVREYTIDAISEDVDIVVTVEQITSLTLTLQGLLSEAARDGNVTVVADNAAVAGTTVTSNGALVVRYSIPEGAKVEIITEKNAASTGPLQPTEFGAGVKYTIGENGVLMTVTTKETGDSSKNKEVDITFDMTEDIVLNLTDVDTFDSTVKRVTVIKSAGGVKAEFTGNVPKADGSGDEEKTLKLEANGTLILPYAGTSGDPIGWTIKITDKGVGDVVKTPEGTTEWKINETQPGTFTFTGNADSEITFASCYRLTLDWHIKIVDGYDYIWGGVHDYDGRHEYYIPAGGKIALKYAANSGYEGTPAPTMADLKSDGFIAVTKSASEAANPVVAVKKDGLIKENTTEYTVNEETHIYVASKFTLGAGVSAQYTYNSLWGNNPAESQTLEASAVDTDWYGVGTFAGNPTAGATHETIKLEPTHKLVFKAEDGVIVREIAEQDEHYVPNDNEYSEKGMALGGKVNKFWSGMTGKQATTLYVTEAVPWNGAKFESWVVFETKDIDDGYYVVDASKGEGAGYTQIFGDLYSAGDVESVEVLRKETGCYVKVARTAGTVLIDPTLLDKSGTYLMVYGGNGKALDENITTNNGYEIVMEGVPSVEKEDFMYKADGTGSNTAYAAFETIPAEGPVSLTAEKK